MSITMIRGSLGVLAAVLFAGAACAEQTVIVSPSDQNHIVRQQAVRYSDLDLATDAGRAQLERRVRFAVADVCDSQNVTSDAAIPYLNCYSAALRGAREQLNAQIAQAQTGAVSAVR